MNNLDKFFRCENGDFFSLRNVEYIKLIGEYATIYFEVKAPGGALKRSLYYDSTETELTREYLDVKWPQLQISKNDYNRLMEALREMGMII